MGTEELGTLGDHRELWKGEESHFKKTLIKKTTKVPLNFTCKTNEYYTPL